MKDMTCKALRVKATIRALCVSKKTAVQDNTLFKSIVENCDFEVTVLCCQWSCGKSVKQLTHSFLGVAEVQ